MTETNVERARRGFEAVLRGDVDAVAEMLAPDVTWGTCRNRDEVLSFMRQARGAAELVDVIDAGDRVVVVLDAGGRRVANLTTFRDGKVVEMVHYPEPDEALRAAGRTPAA
jgi:ketosteroid isomerase-like protein